MNFKALIPIVELVVIFNLGGNENEKVWIEWRTTGIVAGKRGRRKKKACKTSRHRKPTLARKSYIFSPMDIIDPKVPP